MGEWLVKTWLFLSHPRAVYPPYLAPYLDGNKWKEHRGEDLYSWTVTGKPPPAGLSVWASKTRADGPDNPVPRVVFLPTILADDREIEFRAFRSSLARIQVTLVYHPGWPIEHPLEAEGTAVRLWPRLNSEPVDFGAMPRVSSSALVWLEGVRLTFADGTYEPAEMPPLAPSLNFYTLDHPGLRQMEAPPLVQPPTG